MSAVPGGSRIASIGVVAMSTWIGIPLSFITTILVVRLLGPEGRGTVVLLETTVGLLGSLLHFGIPAAMVYYVQQQRVAVRPVLRTWALYSVLGWLAVVGLGSVFTSAYRELFFGGAPISAPAFVAASLLVPLAVYEGPQGSLAIAMGQARLYAIATISRAVVYLAGCLVLLLGFDRGVEGVLIARVISQTIGIAMVGARMRLPATANERWLLPRSEQWTLTTFGLRHYVGSLGAQLVRRADNFFLGYFMGVSAVGYYSVAMTFYALLQTVPQAITPVVFGEVADARRRVPLVHGLRTAQYAMLGTAAVAIPVALASPWLIPWLYGAEFARAVPPLMYLTIAVVFVAGANVLSAVFSGTGTPLLGAMGTVIGGVVNIIADITLIPRFGLVGCAVASLIAAGSMIAYQLVAIRYARGIRLDGETRLTISDVRRVGRQVLVMLSRMRPHRAAVGR